MAAFLKPESGLRGKVPAGNSRLDVPVPVGILKTKNHAFWRGKIRLDGWQRNKLREQFHTFAAGGPAGNQVVIQIRNGTCECDQQNCRYDVGFHALTTCPVIQQ
jgi:hypothetical protein